MFNQPGAASGDKLELENYVGRLLLIYPKEVKVAVATSFGPKDPLVADMVILDGPTAGEELRDAFIFAGVVIGQLKGYIGNPNPALGRLGYGEAKPGQKPPYKLNDFTEQDAAAASAWINAHPRAFNSPAAAHPATQTQGVLPAGQQGGYDAGAAALEQQRQAYAAQQAAQAAGYGQVNTGTGEVSQPAAAAPPAQAGGVNVDTVRTLLNLAIPDAEIMANTGATQEQLNAIRNLPAA
jgi:hypothetical protein